MFLLYLMAFLLILALGCMVFMRDKDGGLTWPGAFLTVFFFAGGIGCLYLLIVGSGVF